MPNYKNEDGTIPSGLKINIMRHCMENKDLLSAGVSHATYVGTGNVDADGVAITAAFDLTSYVTSTKGAGNTYNIESSDIDSKNFERNRIYELSIQNAMQMNETEQFSSLRGMFGILGRDMNISTATQFIKMSPNFNTSWMIYAGLLRFDQLRFITIHKIVDPVAEEFSLQNTYFVLSYGGGCDKILYTESQFTIAKNKNYTIYKMPKFNKDNLYFITAPSHYAVNEDLSVDNSDYEFLDVYSDYDFIRTIRCHYTDSQLSEGVEIGYFSSNFMDSSYISLGYTSLAPTEYLYNGGYVQFEASETWEEAVRRYNNKNMCYGYQTRYIIVGYHQYNSSIDKNTFRFTEIKKILHNSQMPIHLTDSTSPHYMIVFKIVEHNTTT